MQTKLTLRLDDDLILRTKARARRLGKSISQLVAEYFELLSAEDREVEENETPLVRSLRGCLKGGASSDEADYQRFLEEKYR